MNKSICDCCNSSCLVNETVLRRPPNPNTSLQANFGNDRKRNFLVYFRIKNITVNHKILNVRLKSKK